LKKRLWFLQRAFCLDREEIEDLEHTVWLRAFSQMKSYDSQYRFWTWLQQIVRSVFHQQTMKQKKQHLPATIFAELYFQSYALSNNIDGWISDEYVNFLLADLTDLECKIMTRYLLEVDTQRSLTKEMGLSKSRISQIYLKALEKM
jgi:RNA polymerase sigma factor (sigma-70 family)